MSYHPRIEAPKLATFQTTRCRNSELWFVNNPELESKILGNVAKYASRYKVDLYAFAIEGNHTQFPALFPQGNRASFMRDLNSSIARAVLRHAPTYTGGRLWQRRYSAEYLPGAEDIEAQFFYTVLQSVQDGHVQKISQYPGYNCFHDAVCGIKKKFKVIDWTGYNEKKRWSKNVRLKDFTKEVLLEYKRLPGYEHLSQKEYAKLMHEKLEKRRLEILADRRRKGLPCHNGDHLQRTAPGSRPRSSKTSDINSHRPRVLSVSRVRRASCKKWYFSNYFAFKEASRRYREGDLSAEFPDGMYRPPTFTTYCSDSCEQFAA